MSKIIISPGFGGGFIGEFHHRFDPVLIECLEKMPKAKKNERDKLCDLMVARFYQLDVSASKAQCLDLSLADIESGTKFMIEEYDGAEYIIRESDLVHIAP